MCFTITLITVFTHHFLFRKKKSTQSSYLWKVLFPTVIETRIPAHPSGKKKKKERTCPPTEEAACGEGPLEISRGPEHKECRAVKGVRVGKAETEESTGDLRTQLTPGIRGKKEEAIKIRGQGQGLA